MIITRKPSPWAIRPCDLRVTDRRYFETFPRILLPFWEGGGVSTSKNYGDYPDCIIVGSDSWQVNQGGLGLKGNGSNHYAYVSDSNIDWVRLTYMCVFTVIGTVPQNIFVMNNTVTTNPSDRNLRIDASGYFDWSVYNSGAGGTKAVTSTFIAEEGKVYTAVVSVNGTLSQFWLNGIYVGSIAASDPYTSYSTPKIHFNAGIVAPNYSTCNVSLFAGWDVALPDDVCQALSETRYDIIHKENIDTVGVTPGVAPTGQLLTHPGMDGIGSYHFNSRMNGGLNG